MESPISFKGELSADISDSANNIINNTLGKPTNQLGNACGTVLEFFNNTLLLPLQVYNISTKFKLEEYQMNLEQRLRSIPMDKVVTPKVNIIGPAIEALKYNMNEEDLKELFTNLLVNSCNIDYSNKILPQYISILKELSSMDILILKTLYNNNVSDKYIIQPYTMQSKTSTEKYIHIFFTIFLDFTEDSSDFIQQSFDNLIRLNLIIIDFNFYLLNEDTYSEIWNRNIQFLTPHIKLSDDEQLKYKKGNIELTNTARNLLDICIGNIDI